MKGIVVKNQNGYFSISGEGDVLHLCRSRGKLKRKSDILVGDTVEYEMAGTEPSIVRVYPRKNQILRPPAANIDLLVLTVSVKTPAVNVYTLDKMLVLAEHAGIRPMVCVNKADLAEEEADRLAALYKKAGYPAICTSSYTGEGLGELQVFLEQGIIAFSGPSGVGKSSLLNHFLGGSHLESGEVSVKTGRGKNTTRHAVLIPYGKHTFLMDTPGYTSLSVETLSPERVPFLFPELAPYLGSCRFRNCRHLREPDCAVRSAAEKGDIAPSRYQSYCQIIRECSAVSKY